MQRISRGSEKLICHWNPPSSERAGTKITMSKDFLYSHPSVFVKTVPGTKHDSNTKSSHPGAIVRSRFFGGLPGILDVEHPFNEHWTFAVSQLLHKVQTRSRRQMEIPGVGRRRGTISSVSLLDYPHSQPPECQLCHFADDTLVSVNFAVWIILL